MDGILLMENAGIKAYESFERAYGNELGSDSHFVFVAGKGNNGGDALVMARQSVNHGRHVSVVLSGRENGETVTMHESVVRAYGTPVHVWEDDPNAAAAVLQSADVVFDGIFGTGIRGEIRQSAAPLVECINRSEAMLVAVDVPSGVGDEFQSGYAHVSADCCLVMGLPKQCLYLPSARVSCGRIIIVPIGFPEALTRDPGIPGELLQVADLSALLPEYSPDSYKNTRGVVGVFGGSAGTSGAASLAALAALRSGAGLVSLFAESRIYEPAASHSMSVMTRPWDAGTDPAETDLSRFDSFVVGPGWGFHGRLPWLRALVESGGSGVLDADAITLLAGNRGAVPDLGGRWVLTPHPGELARLFGVDKHEALIDAFETVRQLSRDLSAVIVLKSHVTIIAEPGGRYSVVDGMNPAMGTGGTGDLLAGTIGGFIAQGLPPFDAARCGALVHDAAGRQAARDLGWFLSQDLLPYLSQISAAHLNT